MSYWIKPGLVEMQSIYERMEDDDRVLIHLRYAAYDDPTMEAIFSLKGCQRIPLSAATEMFEKTAIAQLVHETKSRYLATIVSGDLGRAAQELAQHGYAVPKSSIPGGMPMQQPAQ